MKKSIGGVLSVLCLLMLLFNPGLALEGARQGLVLWGNVVLPTLLPFMICSGVIVAMDAIHILTGPFKPILSGILSLSDQGSFCLMSGLLCGYPMGAKTTADFVRDGSISGNEGKRLLAIAGCPSPMFVSGYIHSHLDGTVPFLFIAAAVYLPVIINGFLVQLFYRERKKALPSPLPVTCNAAPDGRPFDEIMMASLEIMVKIGGYIMLYSILAGFICESSVLPESVKPLLTGFVEMTTGIDAVSRTMSGLPAALAILFSAVFGGLSGVSQTNTVIKNAGLSIRHYVLWKLLHAALSCTILILLSSL
mgnify:CR=1 FL=1